MSISKNLTIRSSVGLHARPAAEFVKIAQEFNGEVTISYNDQEVDGKSMIGILKLVVAASTAELEEALNKLDVVGGYGYIATWKRNLFSFNPKMLSKRAGLIDENGNLLKVARIPKK